MCELVCTNRADYKTMVSLMRRIAKRSGAFGLRPERVKA
jgi:hypothetical protein